MSPSGKQYKISSKGLVWGECERHTLHPGNGNGNYFWTKINYEKFNMSSRHKNALMKLSRFTKFDLKNIVVEILTKPFTHLISDNKHVQ